MALENASPFPRTLYALLLQHRLDRLRRSCLTILLRLGTGTQVLLLRLQVGQRFEVLALRGFRVFALEAELDFLLADERLQVLRDPLTEPINSGLGMLPGTRHRKGHVYRPFVPLGQSLSLDSLGFCCGSTP